MRLKGNSRRSSKSRYLLVSPSSMARRRRYNIGESDDEGGDVTPFLDTLNTVHGCRARYVLDYLGAYPVCGRKVTTHLGRGLRKGKADRPN